MTRFKTLSWQARFALAALAFAISTAMLEGVAGAMAHADTHAIACAPDVGNAGSGRVDTGRLAAG
jgi:hypothetical protein